MFIDWIHWLLSKRPDELLLVLAPMLLVDIPRYSLSTLAMCSWDVVYSVYGAAVGRDTGSPFQQCPSVCVVVAGLNEADTIGHTLESVWGSYPYMEIVIVDDGSNDGMTAVARKFASIHGGVTVLTKPRRGGKSSALNYALPFTQADVIVCVDGDSHLLPTSIWEIVQPFGDPEVGAVSGTVFSRNPFVNLATWLQALEYLRCIFIGRMLAARCGTLGIISGAFGAYRRETITRLKGWDVGPGEDGDLTLRLRKAGYQIAFAPYAQCFTNVPTAWWTLIKQRRRWEWATITFECRKHIDLANPFSPNFRWINLCLLLERWIFNVFMPYACLAYVIWLACHWHGGIWKEMCFCYLAYVAMEGIQLLVVLYYSTDPGRDLKIGLVAPISPLYQMLLRAVCLWAITEEIFTRRSFRDNFVPAHVRAATWHW